MNSITKGVITTNIEYPDKIIKYTHYLGCGTFILFFMILHLFHEKMGQD